MDIHPFHTVQLPKDPSYVAPDGSSVRTLCHLEEKRSNHHGIMNHFELKPSQTSKAMVHSTVDEIWYVLSGRGQMWRKSNVGICEETIVEMKSGVSLTIPHNTNFQFRNISKDEPLQVVAVTLPNWPGNWEATAVEGAWEATA